MLKKENTDTLNQRLKKTREQLHLTGKEVAGKAGINYQTYMNYEKGGSLPTAENLVRISNILGVSTDYLLKGDKPTPSAPTGQNIDDSSKDESDIFPLIEKIRDILLLNIKNVSFRGKKLSISAVKRLISDVSILERDAAIYSIDFGKHQDILPYLSTDELATLIVDTAKENGLLDDGSNNVSIDSMYQKYGKAYKNYIEKWQGENAPVSFATFVRDNSRDEIKALATKLFNEPPVSSEENSKSE